MRWIRPLFSFYKDGFDTEETTKDDMQLNLETRNHILNQEHMGKRSKLVFRRIQLKGHFGKSDHELTISNSFRHIEAVTNMSNK